MQFNEYLKLCRIKNTLTQEELVHALYSFDIDHFKGLDATTLSKWERGITKPKLAKQVSIIKYFQTLTEVALPCFDDQSEEEIEESICQVGMQNIITESKSKKLILDFPSASMSIDDLRIYQLKNFIMIDKVIHLNTYLDKDFSQNFTQLEAEDFKKWALLPGNLFLACEFFEEIIGLLFILKLKPNIFAKLMNGKIMERELKEEDFALPHEKGSSYMISFFALNQKAASMLFVRYYAHLISHQHYIEEVGTATFMEDAQKLIENINLPYHTSFMIDDGMELQFYKAPLSSFLATQNVIKMILTKQACKEE
jgi:transcriptional regulator with XRE-family HTH domain